MNRNREGTALRFWYVDLDDEGQDLWRMPWLAFLNDEMCLKLAHYFELDEVPSLIIIYSEAKTLNPDAIDVSTVIHEHGVAAYPFTPKKIALLEEINRARFKALKLDFILANGNYDFVINKVDDR